MQWKISITKIGHKLKIYVVALKKLNNKSNTNHLVLRNLTSDNKQMKEICNFINKPKKKFQRCTMKTIIIKLLNLINAQLNAEMKWLWFKMFRKLLIRVLRMSTRGLTVSNNKMLYWTKLSETLMLRNLMPEYITLSSTRLQVLLIS